MRSSDGQYFSKLDHLRALAAFMVFCWHFGHAAGLPFDASPVWPFALFEEGHTGVALFMVLSGYLFAKIINHRRVNPAKFFLNRFVRLAPLLTFVIVVCLVLGQTTITNVLLGFFLPTWPNGGWSIAAELHFYAALPVVLMFLRRKPWLAAIAILGLVVARAAYFELSGSVYRLSYFTIGGRMDQFLVGIAAWYGVQEWSAVKGWVAAAVFVAFTAYMSVFNHFGGIYGMPSDPSTSPIWIIQPTVEAVGYASLILLYDRSSFVLPKLIDVSISKLGELSYSMYLLHFFFFRWAAGAAASIFDMERYYINIAATFIAFLMLIPVCLLSYNLIERPFLRFRVRYAE